jgi:hypothetical protein
MLDGIKKTPILRYSEEKVVQRGLDIDPRKPEENLDPGRLDVRVDQAIATGAASSASISSSTRIGLEM